MNLNVTPILAEDKEIEMLIIASMTILKRSSKKCGRNEVFNLVQITAWQFQIKSQRWWIEEQEYCDKSFTGDLNQIQRWNKEYWFKSWYRKHSTGKNIKTAKSFETKEWEITSGEQLNMILNDGC